MNAHRGIIGQEVTGQMDRQGHTQGETDMQTIIDTTKGRAAQGVHRRTPNKWRAAFFGLILSSGLTLGMAGTAQAALSVSITGPANNTVTLAPANYTLTAIAANAQGAPIQSVAFYANNGTTNTLLGTIAAPSGTGAVSLPAQVAAKVAAKAPIATAASTTYTWNWSSIPMGIYSVTAVVTDKKGTTATSAPVTLVADVPPTVNLTAPAANTVRTAPATFTLTADAAAPIGSIARVEFYSGTTLIGTATAGTNGAYSYTWSNIPWGSYTITAKATDNWGISNTSGPIAVISNEPPTAAMTGPVANTVVTAPATFNLTASAGDVDGTIAKVEFYNGTALIGTATQTNGSYSYTWSKVPYGTYHITAVATDNYGAQTTSAATTVISNQPPTVSITNPADNTTLKTPANNTAFTAKAADVDGTIAKVEFYAATTDASGTTTNTLLATATSAPYSYQWNKIPVGQYTLTTIATDNYGASTTSSPVHLTVKPGALTPYYIHPDQLDTPRMITDTSGNVVWRWDNSDPFGNNVSNENPSGQGTFHFDLRFPGQVYDTETSLVYNVNRDYNPATGRYLQSDPIGLMGGINTYAYVNGNPLSYVDPLGFIQWNGTSTSAGIGKNGETRYTLTSECVDGYKTKVVVEVIYLSFGGGAGWTKSSASFTDNFDYVNPYVFDGPAFNVSAGATAKWGAGFDYTVLGGAKSPGAWSAQQGVGAWAGVSVGISRVISTESIPCSCPSK